LAAIADINESLYAHPGFSRRRAPTILALIDIVGGPDKSLSGSEGQEVLPRLLPGPRCCG